MKLDNREHVERDNVDWLLYSQNCAVLGLNVDDELCLCCVLCEEKEKEMEGNCLTGDLSLVPASPKKRGEVPASPGEIREIQLHFQGFA